ncbi:hypothetical protein HUU53_03465 [Candidatus Micrarchaeota archaeon]|nr:hypothetical protein [Candidatus Micrarchaeota archaeon]
MKKLFFLLLLAASVFAQNLKVIDANCPGVVDAKSEFAFSFKVIDADTGLGYCDAGFLNVVGLVFRDADGNPVPAGTFTDPVESCTPSGLISYTGVKMIDPPAEAQVIEYQGFFAYFQPGPGLPRIQSTTCNFKIVAQDFPVPELNPLIVILLGLGVVFVSRIRK